MAAIPREKKGEKSKFQEEIHKGKKIFPGKKKEGQRGGGGRKESGLIRSDRH